MLYRILTASFCTCLFFMISACSEKAPVVERDYFQVKMNPEWESATIKNYRGRFEGFNYIANSFNFSFGKMKSVTFRVRTILPGEENETAAQYITKWKEANPDWYDETTFEVAGFKLIRAEYINDVYFEESDEYKKYTGTEWLLIGQNSLYKVITGAYHKPSLEKKFPEVIEMLKTFKPLPQG